MIQIYKNCKFFKNLLKKGPKFLKVKLNKANTSLITYPAGWPQMGQYEEIASDASSYECSLFSLGRYKALENLEIDRLLFLKKKGYRLNPDKRRYLKREARERASYFRDIVIRFELQTQVLKEATFF